MNDTFLNKITCGNCLELIRDLDDDSIDGVVTDPPYGEKFDYSGDESLSVAQSLLNDFCEVTYDKLKVNSHLAIFWTMRNLDVCIETLKKRYTYRRVVSMYITNGSARPYLGWLPRTQAIVIAQKYTPKQPSDFHYELATYLKSKLDESKYNRSSLARELGCDGRLVMKWTRINDPGWCLPTPRFYPKLKELLNLDDRYDILYVRRDPSRDTRKDFKYQHDCYLVKNHKEDNMLHPAQKPLNVLEHVVSCVCPEGGIVLDPFAGSGTTAVAAKNTNRNHICFEISNKYCSIANNRLKSI